MNLESCTKNSNISTLWANIGGKKASAMFVELIYLICTSLKFLLSTQALYTVHYSLVCCETVRQINLNHRYVRIMFYLRSKSKVFELEKSVFLFSFYRCRDFIMHFFCCWYYQNVIARGTRWYNAEDECNFLVSNLLMHFSESHNFDLWYSRVT